MYRTENLKTWDDWYKIALKYARTHNGSIANIKEDYVTSDGDQLGWWLQGQKRGYKNRSIPKEKRTKINPSLTDEQVRKLEALNMIWDFKDNTFKVRSICKDYLTYEEFKKYRVFLTRIPVRILEAKIRYCEELKMSLIVNKRLNHIFYVSNKNLEVEYGITIEELLARYELTKKIK